MPKSKNPGQTGKKRPDQNNTEEVWFNIRQILDEKRIGSRIQYLVDWEDNPITGEAYDPTWAWVSLL